MPSCPGRLRSGSEGPRGHKAVPGDSGPAQRACRVDLLLRSTRACIQEPAGSTSCTGRLGPGSDYTRGRPAVPGDSRLFLRARGVYQLSQLLGPWSERPGVDQLSRVYRASVRMRAVSTTFPGDSGSSTRVRVVDQAFGRLRPMPEAPRFQPASRATLDCARCRGAEQLSQGTRTWTEGTRGRPAVPGDTSPGRMANGFDQQSRDSRSGLRA